MISYVKGVVELVENDKIILDNNGIGYGIFMPASELENIGQGEELIIYTYLNVKEDAMLLYGFLLKVELQMFKMLIGVSGVGPKGGMAIISTLSYEGLQMAIVSDDSKAIAKSPGIGSKTAQKIIIELKDKLNIEEMIDISPDIQQTSIVGARADVVDALVSLGYSKTSALNAIKQVPNAEQMDVEELLKQSLKYMIG